MFFLFGVSFTKAPVIVFFNFADSLNESTIYRQTIKFYYIIFYPIILCAIYYHLSLQRKIKKEMTDLLKLENQVCFPVYALAKEIINQYRAFLDQLDLTYPQYLVMLVLWEHKEQTVNQIGEKLRLDSGTLTPLLKRLEQKGIVSRSRSTRDERVVNITLTEVGEELKVRAKHLPENLMASMQVPMEELKALKESVEKILNIIHKKDCSGSGKHTCTGQKE